MSTNKIKAIFDAKKREGKSREFTYKTVAEKMNQQFQQVGVKERITEQQLKYIVNGKTDLGVAKGLALATVLGCSFVDFLPDEVTALANFETELKLIFDSPSEANAYFLEHDVPGRTMIFSYFPSYIYLYPLNRFKTCTKQEATIHNARVRQLKSSRVFTTEYYEIQSILNFAFSTLYTRYNRADKLMILENYLEMFAIKKRKNLLYFFNTNMSYRGFSSYQLHPVSHLITMTTPLGLDCFLQIKSSAIYDRIINFFQEENENIKLLLAEESIELLLRLKTLLLSEDILDHHAIIKFYEQSAPKLQEMLYPNIKHLFDK
jgi:transcriptional regulator with XRE-family HTH domain